MALLSDSFDLDYVEHWMNLLKLDREQIGIVKAYTLLFCVDFISELVSCPINSLAFVAIKMGHRQGGPGRTGSKEGACRD